MAWTDEMVEELRRMWKEGLTTGEIGKRLNVSKNSIVGKVHRLGLSGRPSPIKKKSDAAAPAPKTEKKETPAPQQSAPLKTAKKETSKAKAPAAAPVSTPAPTETVKSEPANAPRFQPKECSAPRGNKVTLTDLDNHTCRWPLGDPKDDNFRFCGKKVRIGQTYCEEHSQVAYVKPGKK